MPATAVLPFILFATELLTMSAVTIKDVTDFLYKNSHV